MISHLRLILFLFTKYKSYGINLNRGYEHLLSTNKLFLIRDCIRKICEAEYSKIEKQKEIHIFRQLTNKDVLFFSAQRDTSYLLTSFYFHAALSNYYIGGNKLIFPLRKMWIDILIENNFNVNKYMCKLLWFLYLVYLSLTNLKKFIHIFFSGLTLKKNRRNSSNFISSPSQNIYFFDISEKNLPENSFSTQQKNLITWYCKYSLKNSPANIIHNVKSYNNKSNFVDKFTFEYYPYLLGSIDIRLKLKNLYWFIRVVFMNLKESWMPKLILNFTEIWEAKCVIFRAQEINLEKIVFNNSIGSLKPLWATVLEKNGIEINYLFYACYAEPRDVDHNLPIDGLWALSTWRNFYVVDEYQKNQLFKELIHKPTKIDFGKIVWWTDTSINLPSINRNSICLFDTILHDNRYTLSTLNQYGWYKPEVAINYLQIVLEVANHFNLIVLYKFKRSKAKNISNKKHLDAVEILLEKYRDIVLLVDDRFSAERLIENATMTISKPLSTTAIIATAINKPSFYLDPTGGVQSDDPACRGIKVINTKEMLEAAVANVLKDMKC